MKKRRVKKTNKYKKAYNKIRQDGSFVEKGGEIAKKNGNKLLRTIRGSGNDKPAWSDNINIYNNKIKNKNISTLKNRMQNKQKRNSIGKIKKLVEQNRTNNFEDYTNENKNEKTKKKK